jgi:hypothetical protein
MNLDLRCTRSRWHQSVAERKLGSALRWFQGAEGDTQLEDN